MIMKPNAGETRAAAVLCGGLPAAIPHDVLQPGITGHMPSACDHPVGVGSVTRKIHSELVLLLGWGRAILLQLAHPLVACAIADHSLYRAQRLRRLHRTLDAMLTLTFGTAQDVERASRAINVAHHRVHGKVRERAGVFPAGTDYSAEDPALLRWVHATLLNSFLRTYELYVGLLTSEEKDHYCVEASGIEPLLRIPEGYLPRSVGELQKYMDETLASGEITVTETGPQLGARYYFTWSLVGRPAAGVAYAAPNDRAATARDPVRLRFSLGLSARGGTASLG